MGFRPGESFGGAYRQPFLRGIFTADPAINALIAQVVRQAAGGPPTTVGFVPGAPLPEVLPPGVSAGQKPGAPLPEVLPPGVEPGGSAVTQAPASSVIEAIIQILRDAGYWGGPGPVAGGPGAGAGGPESGAGGGGGGSGTGGGASSEFEADVEFGQGDLYG